jgi:Rps23 Pro-64 3,4-dihydroxylase Tpa1-like proline 4-hydroxylase
MNKANENRFVSLILDRLQQSIENSRNQFSNITDSSIKTRYFIVDNLLPESDCREIYNAFPDDPAVMREMKSLKEYKYTSKNFDDFPAVLHEISVAFQSLAVIKMIEEITGIQEQIPDPLFYAGGLSLMTKGHFLNPHIDNSHDSGRKLYRTLNLLYYVTPNWNEKSGGNFELWDVDVLEKKTVAADFNRLIVMETNPESWHSVSPISDDKRRCCVSNYYFSEKSPTGRDHFHVTSFGARPEQKFRRAYMKIDTLLRMLVRKFFKSGIGRKDVYKK